MKLEFDFTWEDECWNCEGTGKSDNEVFSENGTCTVCVRGWRVSDQGKDLLKFLRHHLKPECFQEPK